MFATLSSDVRQYLLITTNYWAFTLTDGALRMLVVLHFHALGYSPLDIALLFIFYEIFGVVTNLLGGWLGARLGLNRTMNIGLVLQVVALAMLAVPAVWLTVPWVMAAQALSGIAKDLNKMSAKSAIKLLVPADAQGKLYQWVALLTGSKNTLKGVGFFLGGVLLTLFGFTQSVLIMAVGLLFIWIVSVFTLKKALGKTAGKPKFRELFSKSRAVNILSAARLFLFAARDVWFVVAIPVFLGEVLGWDHWTVGSFMACWVIGYGVIQSLAPYVTGKRSGVVPDGKTAVAWLFPLLMIPAIMAILLSTSMGLSLTSEWFQIGLIGGLMLFGAFFAVNSSLHSYLIVSYAKVNGVSLDVGFYYMANAMGRLLGTLLSGALYQLYGLEACLWISSFFLFVAWLISFKLPQTI
ncbi:organoarsenical effux MFS transporter ArsJ [Neptunomonas qingdaonensis]|uniref:Predicted arabinose efflux permease, MFS family n=1 Tax=Neptunomonas qingdaonensis TaxID=1045558 RepID=A0A1I2NTB6_9GAMM|nr:organoarsenical effux MFS transporter ArsJ [Neptunomonas qingdaonensis]SFG07112.1 Predicted arabinose efflux permease, MFS family [Neptunomonas qingdaonensis]